MFDKEKVIYLERELRLGVKSFDKIAGLQYECVHGEYDKIIVDLSGSSFINPAFLTIIGSLIEIDKFHKKSVVIKVDRSNRNNIKIMRTGIWDYYLKKNERKSKETEFVFNVIKNKECIVENADELTNCLPVHLSEKVSEFISSAIVEVFNNAFEHGEPNKGVYCYGNFDASKKHFIFSIYDDGKGIKKNVQDFLRRYVDDISALKWAMQATNSTRKESNIPGGAGLPFLETFVKCNQGSIFLISGNCLCRVLPNKTDYTSLKKPIMGTLFVMNIAADNKRRYVMREEMEEWI